MFRAESKLGQSEINQGLDNLFQTPVQQQMGDAVLAYGAEQKRMESLVRQQIGDGQLPDVKIFDGTAGKFSDAPPNPPALDAQGRAQSINYADGTSRQFTYKDGKIDTYKDRDGHTWKFTPEDIWTQQDGKSVMHGEMIVDKDGSFTFINHDKNYVSHYGADGKEDLSKQKKYDEYTNEEFLALEMAGKQFAATGLPQESAEKPEKNSSASSSDKPSDPEKPEPKPEPRPEPEPEPKPEKPEPKPEPRPEPEPEPKPEKPEPKPEPRPEPEPEPKPEPKPEPRPEPKPEPKLEPNPDGAVKPLSTEQVQAFARNFQMDPIEVARIGSLTLE